jgi:hypothetical protein
MARISAAAGRNGEVRLQDAMKLEQRLLVEGDRFEIAARDSRFGQAVADGIIREAPVVLDPAEAFLLRRGDDVSVADDAGRRVVIEAAQSQNLHG